MRRPWTSAGSRIVDHATVLVIENGDAVVRRICSAVDFSAYLHRARYEFRDAKREEIIQDVLDSASPRRGAQNSEKSVRVSLYVAITEPSARVSMDTGSPSFPSTSVRVDPISMGRCSVRSAYCVKATITEQRASPRASCSLDLASRNARCASVSIVGAVARGAGRGVS